MKKYKLSNSEEYLMELFWNSNQPLTSIDLLASVTDYDWSANYIHKIINMLQEKGLIKVYDIILQGKHAIRQFVPCMTKEEYLSEMLFERGVGSVSIAKIAMALVQKSKEDQEQTENNEKLIAELEDIIVRFEQTNTEG